MKWYITLNALPVKLKGNVLLLCNQTISLDLWRANLDLYKLFT